MVAGLVAHAERLHRGEHAVLHHRHAVGRVVAELVAARLRLQQQRKGRIAADVDPLDRVHLHRDVQCHVLNPLAKPGPDSVNERLTSYRQSAPPYQSRGDHGRVFQGFPLPASFTRSSRCSPPPPWCWRCRGRHRAPACGADRRVRGGLAGLAECRAHQRPDLRGGDGIARRLHVGGPADA